MSRVVNVCVGNFTWELEYIPSNTTNLPGREIFRRYDNTNWLAPERVNAIDIPFDTYYELQHKLNDRLIDKAKKLTHKKSIGEKISDAF